MSIEITFTDGTIEVIADVHWIDPHNGNLWLFRDTERFGPGKRR